MVIFIRNFIVMCDFLFIILIIVVLFIVSCILEDFVLMEFGKIVFIGIVVFYNFVSDVEVFVVFYEDLNFGEMVWYRCFIDSLGWFWLELELLYIIEVFIGVWEYYYILLIFNEYIVLVYCGEDGLGVSGSVIMEELY